MQAIGIVVVTGGLVPLTFSKGGDITDWKPRELPFPLTTAIAYGTAGVIRRFGLTATPARPLEAVALNETAALLGIGTYALSVAGDWVRSRSVATPTSSARAS